MTIATTLYPARPTAPSAAVPIVLVHGLGGTQFVWERIVEPLTAHAPVITLDLPGFGHSAAPREPWSLAGAADAVAATLDQRGIERCVLVGHSLGGGVVITLALERPDLVDAMGLVAPAGFRGDGTGVALRAAGHAHAVWRALVPVVGAPLLRAEPVRRRVFGSLVHDVDSVDSRAARTFARGAAQGRSTIEARAAILAADQLEACTELAMPVYLVWGTDDRVTSVRMAAELERRIATLDLELLDDVGHMPQWERPDVVVEGIARLVASVRHD